MISPEGAIYQFWASFGLPAFEENNVPDDAGFPRITYELATDMCGNEVALSASLWYRGSSLVDINTKTAEIQRRIGLGGILLPCEGGRIWIKAAQPFAQTMGDGADDMIRRKLINISADFLVNPGR